MATRFYLRNTASSLGGSNPLQKAALVRRGRASVTKVTNTTASGTLIQVTDTAGGTVLEWLTEPLTTAVTISGTVTVNIRGLESANTVNSGRGLKIERCNNGGTVQSTILAQTGVPGTVTEFTTSDAANGAATYTPTSTSVAIGERIKFTLSIVNVGTMNAGTATISLEGAANAAAGDTYIQFNEDFTTDDPMEIVPELCGGGYYY